MASIAYANGVSPGVPTPPNNTPASEASQNQSRPVGTPCLTAVDSALEPIQESHNEEVDLENLPSPPDNTPAFSPAPSVILQRRGRGFSILSQRFADLGLTSQMAPSSNDDGNDHLIGSPRLAPIKEKANRPDFEEGGETASPARSVQVALGSPRPNPLIRNYLDHSRPALNMPLSSSARALSGDTLRGEGVRESSTWAEDAESDLDMALRRLEQLAADEHETDPSASMEEYFIGRLRAVLEAGHRVVRVQVESRQE